MPIDHEFFTVVFKGDITNLSFNPMNAWTVFGEVVAVGMGSAFDEIEEMCDETRPPVLVSLTEAIIEPTPSIKPHEGRIQNWRRHDANGGIGYVIVGRMLDHERLKGCNNAHTSYVVKHDEKTGEIETRNSLYTLVGPESFRDAA